MSETIDVGVPVSGLNIYAKLGLADPESMLIKAQLARKISDAMKVKRLTQAKAAELIGIQQPKLSNILRGQFRGVSEAKMMECLTALGNNVEIVVKAAPLGETARVSVRMKYGTAGTTRRRAQADKPITAKKQLLRESA